MSMIGIMQGRLGPMEEGRFQSFPLSRWQNEFSLAAEAGLDCIEWIDDLYAKDGNPLRTEEGVAAIQRLIEKSGVHVLSLCADSFMEEPIIRCTNEERVERLHLLRFLIDQSTKIGIQHIMLPFVDNSSLQTEEEILSVVESLTTVLPYAFSAGVEIHLETDLDPAAQKKLLAYLPQENLKITYDSGNSSGLGYDPREEFAAYGSRVGSVHLKDRVLGGGTVPLGKGDADLPAVFSELHALQYDGLIIMQVARADEGDEFSWTKSNLAQVHFLNS